MRVLALVCALLIGHPVLAGDLRQITVTGEATVRAAPDMATLSVGANETRPTSVEAMNAVSDALNRVIAHLEAAGVAKQDMQTSRLNLHRKTRWDQGRNREIVEGYQASDMLTVQVRALDQLSTILAAVLDDGANAMHGLSFGLQDPAPLRAEARQGAVADAMAKAALYAQAADVQLGAVMEIREGGAAVAPPFAAAPRMVMAAEAAPVPVAEGEVEARAQIIMVFEIK
ncbi:MAG: SIMPL domain-containing protein [Pelagimonas sp.]|jgi:uncharacterized protein YggE|nr:SIMPL domain-containing protein [Pelagimonas sp.]